MTPSDKLQALIRYAFPGLPAEQVAALAELQLPAWLWLEVTPDSAFASPAGCHQLVVSVREALTNFDTK